MTGRALLLLGAGFAIWASAFVVLYGMLSVGCAFGWEQVEIAGAVSLQRLQLLLLFLLHLAAVLTMTLLLRGAADRSFLHRAGYLAALAASGSTLFSYGAVFFLSPCL